MKNLPTKINYSGLITPQIKFQPAPMKGERKYSFLVSSYSIVKYKTNECFKYSHSHSLKTLISHLVLKRTLRKYIFLPPHPPPPHTPPFVISELALIKVKCVRKQ